MQVTSTCAHNFVSHSQLPFFNQWKGETGHRNALQNCSCRKMDKLKILPFCHILTKTHKTKKISIKLAHALLLYVYKHIFNDLERSNRRCGVDFTMYTQLTIADVAVVLKWLGLKCCHFVKKKKNQHQSFTCTSSICL